MKKVLLIDDDDLQKLLYTKLFRQFGMKIDTASNKEALLLDWSTYSSVLVDIMMPGLSGNELVQIIAKRIGAENMPHVILFSVLNTDRLNELANELTLSGLSVGRQTKLAGDKTVMRDLVGKINEEFKDSNSRIARNAQTDAARA